MNRELRLLGLSKSARYALVGLVHLARLHGEGRVLVEHAASALNLPPSYLAKLFQRMAHKGLLESHRGPGGGYILARAPESISLAEIIGAMQDPTERRRECLLEAGPCQGNGVCAIHDDVISAERRVLEALSRITLAQAAQPQKRGSHAA